MSSLTDSERNFLSAQIKKAKTYQIFCYLDIAAVIAIITYMVITGHVNSIRVVLAIILLINARSNLRQYKLATILGAVDLSSIS